MSTPLRIGIIGLDTSHVIAFSQIFNDPKNAHHLSSGRIAVAFPGGSPDFPLSINRVEGYTKQLRDDFGVKIVDDCASVAKECDLVMIESVDGRVHLDQFKQTLAFKKPTYIDKPLAVCSDEAREIFRLAKQNGIPLMSASSLRYADGVVNARDPRKQQELGAIRGCDVFGPMEIEPTQPGLYWYGIHSVEMMVAIMGAGCQQVQTDMNANADIVTATWGDGRVAVLRGNRKAHSSFGAVVHHEKAHQYVDAAAGRPKYVNLLDAIMRSLPQGHSDIPEQETLDIIRLIEAANESRENGGRVVKL